MDTSWIRWRPIPYIASEIIENTKLSLLCNKIIDIPITSERYSAKEKHSDCVKVQFDYSHGNILLTAGAGHIEKNLLLAFASDLLTNIYKRRSR